MCTYMLCFARPSRENKPIPQSLCNNYHTGNPRIQADTLTI